MPRIALDIKEVSSDAGIACMATWVRKMVTNVNKI